MLAAAALAACTRSGPPAPVFTGDGISRSAPTQQARATPQPTPAPARRAPAPQEPLDRVTVGTGDTVYTLSRKHNVTLRDLIDANRLAPPYALTPGQEIVLPLGQRHRVKDGETLYGVSRLYGVDARVVVKLNNLQPPYKLNSGQTLILPRRAPEAAVTVARATPDRGSPPRASDAAENIWRPVGPTTAPAPAVPASEPSSPAEAMPEVSPAPTSSPPAKSAAIEIPDASPPRAGSGFQWPVRGRILSRFGVQSGGLHNDGINIAAARGTPVHSAENGVVVYAGNELPGFGNLVIVRHADGWMTAYGHNEALRVRRGDTVRRGQVIATVGRSGGVTEPQLHFEIRRGSEPVDPSQHLAAFGPAEGRQGAAVTSGGGRASPPNPG